MTLIRWQPRDVFNLHREIDEMVNTFWGGFGEHDGTTPAWNPKVDVSETDDGFVVRAELPGLSRKDIKVTVKENVLTVEGEKRKDAEDKGKSFYRAERSYGHFSRSFSLPANVDAGKISATHKDGVLTLAIPKAEAAKPKEIEVKVA